jgi:IS30 family transposase
MPMGDGGEKPPLFTFPGGLKMRTFKQLTWDDRLKIETMLLDGKSKREIAERIKVHISTICREIKRGRYQHKNTDWTFTERYSPEIADQKYRAHLAAKGPALKIGKDHELAGYIEKKIIEGKYSPAAVLGEIQRKGLRFMVTIKSPNTIYSYIDKSIFLNLTNDALPVRRNKKREYKHVRAKRAPKGDSIEKRPEEIEKRTTFGHWEMDTVKGNRNTKSTLLVLTERLSRREIEIKMADGTSESVVRNLDALEKRYGKIFPIVFKSITVDNGSEFADYEGMKKSVLHEGERTKFYYCHPYSSWERGSNENQNKLIRRWIPKGSPIENYTDEEIQRIETWINDYPRKIFDWGTSAEMFAACLAEATV